VLGLQLPGPAWVWLLNLVTIGAALSFICACWRSRGKKAKDLQAKHRASVRGDGRHQYVFEDKVVYEWDQTQTTITMYARPPEKAMKNIEVVVWPDRIYIGRKGKPAFLEEELYSLIDTESSSWLISPEGELEICLAKAVETEWPGMLRAHTGDYVKRTSSSSAPPKSRTSPKKREQ